MKYALDFSEKFDVFSTPASGFGSMPQPFRPWLPSTWPQAPAIVDANFIEILKRIFEETILGEIHAVIEDILKLHKNLEHRGHVIALATMCAMDAISSYGYLPRSGKQIPDFVKAHFPVEYHPHADDLLGVYRNTTVHSWNLFKATILPGNDPLSAPNGHLSVGLLTLFSDLVRASEDFLNKLPSDLTLQQNTLARYEGLRKTAIP